MSESSNKIFKIACQSEELFLLHNKEVLQAIKSMQRATQSLINHSELHNAEAIHVYKEYVNIISKLVLEIGITNNSISYSEIIAELINSGYLSYGNKFIYGYSILNDIVGYGGISIINGYGCCRHTSSIHKDIFNDLGMDSEYVQCNMYDTEVPISEMYHNPSKTMLQI